MHILLTFVLLISTSLMANELTQESSAPSADQKPAVRLECWTTFHPKYHTLQFGNPYQLCVHNLSDVRVKIDPSVIQHIASKEMVIVPIKEKCWCAVGALSAVTGLTGVLTGWLFKIEKFSVSGGLINPASQEVADFHNKHPDKGCIVVYDHNDVWVKVGLGVTLFGIAGTAVCAWNSYNLEAELSEVMFHTPLVLEPGQEVSRLFWLQDPAAEIQFDFEAIQIVPQ